MTANPHTSPLVGFPLALQLAKAGGNSSRIEGYASVFGGPPDHYGRIIASGAFRTSITDHQRAGTMPAMLWHHDIAAPVGRWVHMEEDSRGLHVVGNINTATQRGQDALAHLRAGDINGLSIGWNSPAENTRRNRDGTVTFTRADLLEISVVSVPANSRARIFDVASVTSERQFARMLHAAGFSKSVSAKLAAGGWATLREGNPSHQDVNPAGMNALLARVRAATAAIKP